MFRITTLILDLRYPCSLPCLGTITLYVIEIASKMATRHQQIQISDVCDCWESGIQIMTVLKFSARYFCFWSITKLSRVFILSKCVVNKNR